MFTMCKADITFFLLSYLFILVNVRGEENYRIYFTKRKKKRNKCNKKFKISI